MGRGSGEVSLSAHDSFCKGHSIRRKNESMARDNAANWEKETLEKEDIRCFDHFKQLFSSSVRSSFQMMATVFLSYCTICNRKTMKRQRVDVATGFSKAFQFWGIGGRMELRQQVGYLWVASVSVEEGAFRWKRKIDVFVVFFSK